MDSIAPENARQFEKEFYNLLKSSHPEALELILKNDIDAAGKILERAAKDLSAKFAKL